MSKQTKPLSWEPIRRGARYCAPACGRGCTRAEYEHALALATATAHALGPGWTAHVHENLGWHARAISPSKRIKVAVNRTGATGKPTGYTAFLGEPGTACSGRWAESGAAPRDAVLSVLARAVEELAEINAILNGAHGELGP